VKNNKLLFLCPSYPAIGGVEAVTSLLIDFFLGKGYEVFILVSKVKKMPGSMLDKHYRRMTIVPGTFNSKENLDFIDDFISSNDIACVFNQAVFSKAYLHASMHKDVLFINTLHSCPYWEVIKFRYSTLKQLLREEKVAYRKVKVIIRFILNKVKPGLSHPSINSYYKGQIDSVSYYVVLDPAYKMILEKDLYGGVGQEKIQVIPDPLVLPEQSLQIKQNKVLYVGRLTREPKRVDRLLRIWRSIQPEVQDWELQIVGDGDQRRNLERMSARLQLRNVSFCGFQDPAIYYDSAAILCLTSTYEGFGMVLVEAMSYGVVPISFRSSDAIGSVIDQGVNGLIIEPYNEENFARELLSLMKEGQRRSIMSQKAKEKVLDFELEKIGQKWLNLISK